MRSEHWYRAFWAMMVAGLAFSTMALLVKQTAPHLGVATTFFFRSCITFSLVSLVLIIKGIHPFPKGYRLLLIRGVMGAAGLGCYFYSLTHLPLTIAAVLGKFSPFFSIILSSLLLNETVPRKFYLYVLLAMGGLFLLTEPEITQQSRETFPLTAVVVALLGAWIVAGVHVLVRLLTSRYPLSLIIWYFAATAWVCSLPFAYQQYQVGHWEQLPKYYGSLIAIGLLSTLAQYLVTAAFKWGKGAGVSFFGLSTPFISILFGLFFLGERLFTLQWLGLVAVVVAVVQGLRIVSK